MTDQNDVLGCKDEISSLERHSLWQVDDPVARILKTGMKAEHSLHDQALAFAHCNGRSPDDNKIMNSGGHIPDEHQVRDGLDRERKRRIARQCEPV